MKKLMSLLFASMVVFGLTMPVFANDTPAPSTTKTAKTAKATKAKATKTPKSHKGTTPAPAKTN